MYSELISLLLIVEFHKDLLMKSSKSQPTGSVPFPEVNMIKFHQSRHEKSHDLNCGRDRGQKIKSNHVSHLARNNELHHQQCKEG